MSAAHEAYAQAVAVGLATFLQSCRTKIETTGGFRGRLPLPESKEERSALVQLGCPFSGQYLLLAELDAAFRRSRFQVGLVDVLAAGGGPLVTRAERKAQVESAWAAWWEALLAALPVSPVVDAWRRSVRFERAARSVYRDDPEAGAALLGLVGRALATLPAESGGQPELLALFAARIAGDPHAFDLGRPGGGHLLQALSEWYGEPPEGIGPAERRALVLDRAGLMVDQVSSTVLVAGLAGATAGGEVHPVVAAMATYGGAWALTLGEVRLWEGAAAYGHRAYIVENPAVFETLLAAGPLRRTLVCTAGWPSTAAIKLLDGLVGSGAELYYSGDYDKGGLAITAWLIQRYGDQLRPWRMDEESYRHSLLPASPALTEAEVGWLGGLQGPLAALGVTIAQRGRIGYQEQVTGLLIQDLWDVDKVE